MQQISRVKMQEVIQHYLLGNPYERTSEMTGVSYGTVANIINEVDNRELGISGGVSDQINDLRQLSLDLKKKKLERLMSCLGFSCSKVLSFGDKHGICGQVVRSQQEIRSNLFPLSVGGHHVLLE
jgi:RNase P/RNase MRP subunit p29